MAPDNPTSTELATDPQYSRVEMEDTRRAQIKAAVEQELQHLIGQAAQYRNQINTAKTHYKKQFYGKKMKSLNEQVMQMIVAMQRLDAQQAATEPSPEYVNDQLQSTETNQ